MAVLLRGMEYYTPYDAVCREGHLLYARQRPHVRAAAEECTTRHCVSVNDGESIVFLETPS